MVGLQHKYSDTAYINTEKTVSDISKSCYTLRSTAKFFWHDLSVSCFIAIQVPQ